MSYIDPAGKLIKHIDRIVEIQRGNRFTPPVNVEIDLSNRCSLGCEGCHFAYVHTKGPLAKLNTAYTGDLMNTYLMMRILDQLQIAGVRSITWSGGGEPTLHPDFDEIIRYNPLPQGIYTNGAQLDVDRAKVLKDKMTWVYISLDYCERDSYKRHKKVDAFDRVIKGVKRLIEAPGKAIVGLGFLLWKENWQDIGDMIALKDELGADYIQFRPMVFYDPKCPSELNEDTEWMSPLIVELESYWENCPGVIFDINRFRNYQNWRGHGYNTCWWSRMQTVITPDARVWTCVNRRGMDGDAIGDLNNELFINIWSRNQAKMVDKDCRVMCRGHVPNVALDEMGKRPQGHDLFV